MNQERSLHARPSRAVALTLALCLLLLSPHCGARVTRPGPVSLPQLLEPARRPDPARIEVAVGGGQPAVSTGGYARGKCRGAAVGAGRAVGRYFGEAFAGGCDGGAFCGLYAVVVVLFAPVVAIGGSIAGAAGSVSKKDVRKMEAFLEQATSASRVERAIAESIRADLPGGAGSDAVLEVGPVNVRGFGHGGNSPVLWEISAQARLVRTSDGTVLQSGAYTYHSCGRRLREWVRNDLARLRVELQRARRSLAERIGDEFLLLDPIGRRPPLASATQTSKRRRVKPRIDDPPAVYLGLRPVQPPTLGTSHRKRLNGLPRYEFPRFAAPRPTLRWEAFEPAGPDADRVRNVTYEIRIARAEDGLPEKEVYRREGLTEPQHTVRGGIAPGHDYFWTVRARFEVDGQPRVTEWGGIHPLSRVAAEVPGVHSYRFRTSARNSR